MSAMIPQEPVSQQCKKCGLTCVGCLNCEGDRILDRICEKLTFFKIPYVLPEGEDSSDPVDWLWSLFHQAFNDQADQLTQLNRLLSIAAEKAQQAKERYDVMIWCDECGPNVLVDEDGCCRSCGHDAVYDDTSELVRAVESQGRSTTLQSCQPYLQHQKFCMMLQPSLLSAGDGPAQCSCGLAALHASDPPTEQ